MSHQVEKNLLTQPEVNRHISNLKVSNICYQIAGMTRLATTLSFPFFKIQLQNLSRKVLAMHRA
ncbi:hypothetical protein OB69_05125 [Roseivirga seohaensis subsp. aquiponti]|uniref:Uncharacterized protein n=1 Tax=Roseivirga seohaensis subsp. aquiponti TaxID=1566026 RepID=A0A0L8AN37_9BACT|nr:hypothetical protein OB69_05125 [Roseivirga seohaensis subsp. aquiponti]